MKMIKYILALTIYCAALNLNAQEHVEKLVIPLSKPGEKGILELGIIKGSIKVEGYNGKEVIVIARSNYTNKESKKEVNGLRRINSSSFSLDIEEKDNHIDISTDHATKKIDFEIKVPTNFSLDIGTVNDGQVVVSNVSGNHEISNVNGSIKMNKISGSVVASTINGIIKVDFEKISPNTPMAFANFNNNIDISIPANSKVTLKMDNKMGDILTDFETELIKTGPTVNKSHKSGVYKVEVSQVVTANINGGGPEFKFKNFNGDIIVRKKK